MVVSASGGFLRICLVVVSDGWGGAEAVVYELAKRFRFEGHEVNIIVNSEVVSFYEGIEGVGLVDLGRFYPFRAMAMSRLGPRSEYRLLTRFLFLFSQYLDELYMLVNQNRLRRLMAWKVQQKQPEVIHSHLADATYISAGLVGMRIPCVATFHGEHELLLPGRRRVNTVLMDPLVRWFRFNLALAPLVKWKERRFRKALARMHVVTVLRSSTAGYLATWERALNGKIVVIPNGIDIDELQHSIKATYALKGKFNILCPGGSKLRKGSVLLVKALAIIRDKIPGIHAYFSGKIPNHHPIRELVQDLELGENTTFVGFVTTAQYRSLLQSVDVFAMPSLEEGGGPASIACLEAMAAEKPIVAGRVEGMEGVIVDGRNGLLVKLDPLEVANAILRLYRDTELRQAIEKNNRKDSTKFDWSLIVDQYIQLFQALKPS